jgi:glycosyltransferase involved in cell wall biosynthesis
MSTLLFIGHEASASGAPFTQLYLIKWLKKNTTHKIVLILLVGGVLEEVFREVADEVHIVSQRNYPTTIKGRAIAKLNRMTNYRHRLLIRRIQELNPALMFANTALTIEYAAKIKEQTGIKLLINIHELGSAFSGYSPQRFEANIDAVDLFIMGSYMVKGYYQDWCGIDDKKAVVVYDFIDANLAGNTSANDIRVRFNIPQTSKVVVSIAELYPRKGADLFVRVAQIVLQQEPDTYFIWVGGRVDSPEYKAIQRDVKLLGLDKSVLFVGEQRDLLGYYELLDVFLLPSREDPFPLVCLEAAVAGNPIICFEKAGGMPEFVRNDAGIVVSYLDTQQMADSTLVLLRDATLAQKFGEVAKQRALAEHTITTIGPAMHNVIERFI